MLMNDPLHVWNDEMSFTVRGATGVTLQPHQILRLPRKMTLMIDPYMKRHLQCEEQHGATGITLQPHQILRLQRKIAIQHLREICRKQLKRRLQCAAYSTMIRLVLKIITTCRAPAIYQNFTEYCACHEKCHCNITKYCACHEKRHCNITKYRTCHEKWPPGVTK